MSSNINIDFFLEPESLRAALFENEEEARIADTILCSKFRHAIDKISTLYEIPYLTVRAAIIEARSQQSMNIYGLCDSAVRKQGWILRKLESLRQ